MDSQGHQHAYPALRYDHHDGGSIGASSAAAEHTFSPAANSTGTSRIYTTDSSRGADYNSPYGAVPSLDNGLLAGNAYAVSHFPTTSINSNQQFAYAQRRASQTGWDSEAPRNVTGHGPAGPISIGDQAQNSERHQEYQMDLNHSRSQQHPHYSGGIPGSLQPGGSARPGPISANTAPSTVPTLPPISTQTQLTSNSSRGTMANHSHSYSQGSPAGLDQPRHPHQISTPDESKFASPPSNRYTASRPPQNTVYSPLGLADIRPRGDTAMSDGQVSANPYSESFPAVPSNCNYLAPWAVYAFDWCKWPVNQHGMGDSAGKMAIGSYLEDGHNFVRVTCHNTITIALTALIIDTNPRNTDSARARARTSKRCTTVWYRVCEDCRSHTFLSSHTNTVGARVAAETVHRFVGNVWGSPATVVSTCSTCSQSQQFDHPVCEYWQGFDIPETYPFGTSLQFEISRTYCPIDFSRLEHPVSKSHHNVKY